MGDILLLFCLKCGTVRATAEKQGFCLPHARVVLRFFSASFTFLINFTGFQHARTV